MTRFLLSIGRVCVTLGLMSLSSVIIAGVVAMIRGKSSEPIGLWSIPLIVAPILVVFGWIFIGLAYLSENWEHDSFVKSIRNSIDWLSGKRND